MAFFMRNDKFDAEDMLEFAETERMKERARIMLAARELAKEMDSLIINNFILELGDRITNANP